MYLGIDCATKLTADTAKRIKGEGYKFVCRYLVPNSGSLAWKALTPEEIAAIRAAGLRLLSVWETTADRAKTGTDGGTIDGQRAVKLAREYGQPENTAIYFAVDFDAQKSDYDSIAKYFAAAAAEIKPYKCGIYGGYKIVEEMRMRGVVDCIWQCVAWSYGAKSNFLNVYQYDFNKTVCGVAVDIDSCPNMDAAGMWPIEADAGAWAQDAIAWAVANGIMQGTGDGNLELDRAITRREAVAMLYRAFMEV